MNESIKVGDKIHFLRELSDSACEEHPGCLYASKGEVGEITRIGGCREGYWVKTKKNPPFGCERHNFELVNLTKELFIKELNKFVSHDKGREYINRISMVDDNAVATNAFVMAWVNQDLVFEHVDGFPVETANEFISNHDAAQFKPFKMPELNLEKCPLCHGQGYTYKDPCMECDGAGELHFESNYNHYDVECKKCSGVGTTPSSEEFGIIERCMKYDCEGGFLFDNYIEIDNALIDPRYLKLIQDYPNLEISIAPVNDDKTAKLFFFKSSNQVNVIIMGAIK